MEIGVYTDVLVECGPVVGTVTSTSAVVLMEVDQSCTITIVLTAEGEEDIRLSRTFPTRFPRAFYIQGLKPDTLYTYTFEGLARSHKQDIDKNIVTTIRTLPEKVKKMRLIALSCDRPRRLWDCDENPWDRILKQVDQCDVMLHLGDQVYSKMDGFMDRAEMKMRCYDDATAIEKRKMLREAGQEMRDAYRYTWNLPSTRAVLAQSSHLMIWSDNDAANDFTEKLKPSGEQYYTHQFLMCAMRIYTEYQRQLWDPKCEGILPLERDPKLVNSVMEEWHFHQYGTLGVFLIDMRGNRVTCGGNIKPGKIMSDRQFQALKDAFETEGLSCMLVCSEIPFVTSEPKKVQEKAKKIKFLEGHWCYDEEGTGAMFDLAFDWKAEKEGRQVLFIGGDVHIGFTTDLHCNKTNSTIKCVTTTPITNHVCEFYEQMEGDFNERYHFKHEVYPSMRNYCVVDAEFDEEGKCKLDVKMELIPATPDE